MQTFSDIIKSRAQPVEKKGRFKVQKVDEDKRVGQCVRRCGRQ